MTKADIHRPYVAAGFQSRQEPRSLKPIVTADRIAMGP